MTCDYTYSFYWQHYLYYESIAALTPYDFSAPSLSAPLDGAREYVAEVDLKWIAVEDADFYVVQWSRNSSFQGPYVRGEKVVATESPPDTETLTITIADDDIRYDQRYYWRVRAYKSGGWASPFSDVREFEVAGLPSGQENDADGPGCGENGVYVHNPRFTKPSLNPDIGESCQLIFDLSVNNDRVTLDSPATLYYDLSGGGQVELTNPTANTLDVKALPGAAEGEVQIGIQVNGTYDPGLYSGSVDITCEITAAILIQRDSASGSSDIMPDCTLTGPKVAKVSDTQKLLWNCAYQDSYVANDYTYYGTRIYSHFPFSPSYDSTFFQSPYRLSNFGSEHKFYSLPVVWKETHVGPNAWDYDFSGYVALDQATYRNFKSGDWVRITGYEAIANEYKKWKYSGQTQYLGLTKFYDSPTGRTFTNELLNAIESHHTYSSPYGYHVQPNSVYRGNDYPSGFDFMPVRGNPVVQVWEVERIDGTIGYVFTYENADDGTCGTSPLFGW